MLWHIVRAALLSPFTKVTWINWLLTIHIVKLPISWHLWKGGRLTAIGYLLMVVSQCFSKHSNSNITSK